MLRYLIAVNFPIIAVSGTVGQVGTVRRALRKASYPSAPERKVDDHVEKRSKEASKWQSNLRKKDKEAPRREQMKILAVYCTIGFPTEICGWWRCWEMTVNYSKWVEADMNRIEWRWWRAWVLARASLHPHLTIQSHLLFPTMQYLCYLPRCVAVIILYYLLLVSVIICLLLTRTCPFRSILMRELLGVCVWKYSHRDS